jgi:uncharacterized alpha-E superfamily protein
VLSPVADSLYWMSRYLERAQHRARVVGVNLSVTLDRTPDSSGRQWQRLSEVLTGKAPESVAEAVSLVVHLTFETTHQDSVSWCIAAARENARQVREQISSEMWEQVNRLYWQVRDAVLDARWQAQPDEFFRSLIASAYLFEGLTDATMSRGEGWHFIQLGRFLERAQATALLLDVQCRSSSDLQPGAMYPADSIEWVALLRSCTSFEAYCRRYTATLEPRLVAAFLLLDEELPRSVRFAVEQVERSLKALVRLSGRQSAGSVERIAGRLRASLNYAVIDEIVANSLPRYLDEVRRQCSQIHAAMYESFIDYELEPALR